MKQVIQSLRTGTIGLLYVPAPRVAPGHVLVRTRASVISAGTERSLIEFGRANLLAKARNNPDRVRQVLDKIRTDGFWPTVESVFAKLDEPFALGYCQAGEVLDLGEGVESLVVGDRVASNGPHAEIVHQPLHLSAKIPDDVPFEHAAFTPLAAIALQGARLIAPQLGELVAVFGLGLVGLLAVQILAAHGCRVLAIDLDAKRLELARQFGAEPLAAGDDAPLVANVLARTGGIGVDAVLIAASAKDDTILSQAARMTRQRGRIVLVGVVNTQINRHEFYAKELSFQVSCSYGPGRYDEQYEEHGVDYPLPYVRWTEQRNFAAVLELMARGKLDVAPLITSRIPHADAPRAYELLATDSSQLGIVFTYPEVTPDARQTIVRAGGESRVPPSASAATGQACVGVIGAGNFTQRTLLPALRRTPARLHVIASAGGLSAAYAARKFGIARSTSDSRDVVGDLAINTVFITTPHHLHAPLAVEALRAGKHVFVEKPLAIDSAGLVAVQEAYGIAQGRHLMVGYNRRFAPLVERMKNLLANRVQPACAVVTINAGGVPAKHWLHDPQFGGGRLIGEGCHWIDLLRFLLDSPIVSVQATMIGNVPAAATRNDHVTVTLRFADGSIGTLHYFANGHRGYPKERLEVFWGGRVLALDNFRVLRGWGIPRFIRQRLWRQDKGHQQQIARFVTAIIQGGPPLIPPDQLWNVAAAALAAAESARSGQPVEVA